MEAKVINAVSKYRQTEEMLLKMTERALGRKVNEFKEKELAGGLCNAVYLISADGEDFVLKIAQEKTVKMMRHEKDSLDTEARVLKLLEEKTMIRAPRLVYYDKSLSLCDAPYFFMTFMEGQALATIEPRPEEGIIGGMKKELGEFCKQMSNIKTEYFGIPSMPETYTDNNCDFMIMLFHMLFLDARERDIFVPECGESELLELIESQRSALNEAKQPCYIHTDTWEGNLMVKDSQLEGLVDFAAVLYGDPLMNHDFHDFLESPREEFLEGFGKVTFTKNEQIRISIYKIWQRLGMIVERGYRGYEEEGMYKWVLATYVSEIGHLRELVNS